MAKKAAGAEPQTAPRKRARQTKFCDSFDELPEEVQDAVKTYSDSLTQRMIWQDEENAARSTLLDLMEQHRLKFIPDPNDDEKVFALQLGEPEKKVRKIPKSKALAECGKKPKAEELEEQLA